MHILGLGKKETPIARVEFNSSVYTTACVVDNVLYITDRSRLYAIGKKPS